MNILFTFMKFTMKGYKRDGLVQTTLTSVTEQKMKRC